MLILISTKYCHTSKFLEWTRSRLSPPITLLAHRVKLREGARRRLARIIAMQTARHELLDQVHLGCVTSLGISFLLANI